MVRVEHLAGVYLANPPAVNSPAITIAVLAILAGAVLLAWMREELAHR